MGADTRTRTLFVGLDACDPRVAQEFAAAGDMPTLARLLDHAAVQDTLGPYGFLGGNWPSIYTGTGPARHQHLRSGQVRGGTYEHGWLPPISDPPGIWEWVSRAGGRVAVLDAPYAAVAERLNGVQLVEWGGHDRRAGTSSYPAKWLDDVNTTYGPHRLGTFPVPFPHDAPCDLAHRDGDERTVSENEALLLDLLEGSAQKTRLSVDLLAQGNWDLFFTVLGEAHCVGHQFWKFHDPTHPSYDAAQAAALGGDPVRAVYAALDRGLGALIHGAGPDAMVYVLLSHGMTTYFDGTRLLEQVLWRLDEFASGSATGGLFTRGADAAVGMLPRTARQRALSALMLSRRRLKSRPMADTHTTAIPPWIGRRRWWLQPNDSPYMSVRLNLEGREPNGRIAAARARDAALWLAERLSELVDVDTAQPVVTNVALTGDHYERSPDDPLGDLIIEWTGERPVERVWSPVTGVVSASSTHWRSGGHYRDGLLLASGPRIAPGRRAGAMSVVDIAPTLAASLGLHSSPDVFDGRVHADLVPADAATEVTGVGLGFGLGAGSEDIAPVVAAARPDPPRQWSAAEFDVDAEDWMAAYVAGVSETVGDEQQLSRALRAEVDHLQERVRDLEQLAKVTATSAWLHSVDVPESMLVSIVTPTRNRRERLARAIASVQAQTYTRWELLVVDDASTDGTSAMLEELAVVDDRVRPFRNDPQQGSSLARNVALDNAKGDVIAYLDDDNTFDRDWLRSVVWACGAYPGETLFYGARVIDDEARYRGFEGPSHPMLQLLPWDRDAQLRGNLIDQNVIAHRPSPTRFNAAEAHVNDWDLLLQLTDDCDPFPLPVVAAYYTTDLADRLSADFTDPDFVDATMERIRKRTIERRRADS